MTKTSDTSRDELDKLTMDELEAVKGGINSSVSSVIKSIGNAISKTASTSTSSDVWVGCAWVPQWW